MTNEEVRAQVETQRAEILEWMDDISRRGATPEQPTNGELGAFAGAMRWFQETAPEHEEADVKTLRRFLESNRT